MARTIKDCLTDAEVECEISRLLNSDAVHLAKKEKRILNRRRQYMYQLRTMEKRGKALMKSGVTMENMEAKLFGGSVEGMADDDE